MESRDTSSTGRALFERLYSASEKKVAAGKERRLKIEKSLASKNQRPDFPDKKLPVSQAEEYYYKSIKHVVEKDEKLAAAALERDRSFKAQFNFNEHLLQKAGAMGKDEFISRLNELSDPDDQKIPLSQAEEFYYRAVRHAKEKDDKLAAIALERDRSYKAQFNFNEDLQVRSGAIEEGDDLSIEVEQPDENAGKKMSLNQADEFYHKAIIRAMEKDERLAAAALERDRSYKAQFNFNAEILREK